MEKNEYGYVKTSITRIPTEKGESLEEMIRRSVENNEPIEATAPMVYTEEADGVKPEFDIRTDRTDLALDAIDKYQKSEIAKGKIENQKTNPKANKNKSRKCQRLTKNNGRLFRGSSERRRKHCNFNIRQ